TRTAHATRIRAHDTTVRNDDARVRACDAACPAGPTCRTNIAAGGPGPGAVGATRGSCAARAASPPRSLRTTGRRRSSAVATAASAPSVSYRVLVRTRERLGGTRERQRSAGQDECCRSRHYHFLCCL